MEWRRFCSEKAIRLENANGFSAARQAIANAARPHSFDDSNWLRNEDHAIPWECSPKFHDLSCDRRWNRCAICSCADSLGHLGEKFRKQYSSGGSWFDHPYCVGVGLLLRSRVSTLVKARRGRLKTRKLHLACGIHAIARE